MSTTLFPLLTLILGALLGFFSTVYVTTVKHRHEIIVRIVDQYFEIRRELVEEVSQLTFLRVNECLGDEERFRLQKTVSRLFYKHYDFLQRPVLDALALLRITLEKYNGVVYGLRGDIIYPMKQEEVAQLIDRCSLFANAKLFAPIALSSRDLHRRANEAVKLQARNVLSSLNDHASIEDLLSIANNLKKRSSAS